MNAGHTNAHQNHFLIARGNDLLAIDSGVYDGGVSSHHRNYFERTIAHNTITVYNPSETTFGSLANDGGQIPPSEELPVRFGDASASDYYRGEIVGYRDTEEFTYMKGDATAAYNPSKVTLFTREMVYLKPDIFVVLDRVRATSASYKKRWLLHSVNEPTITGDTVMVQEGTSRLFVKSLLPAHADDHEGRRLRPPVRRERHELPAEPGGDGGHGRVADRGVAVGERRGAPLPARAVRLRVRRDRDARREPRRG